MTRERWKWWVPDRARAGAYLLLVFVSAGAAAWFAGAFGRTAKGDMPMPLSGGGVTLSRVGPNAAIRGPAAQGIEGDWLLETQGVRLVVGSDADGVDRQLGHGVMLDLTAQDWQNDALFGVSTIALGQGHEIALRMLAVEPVVEGGRPALRVAQSSRDNFLRLNTWIRLEPGRPWLELVTRAENRGRTPIRALSLGDRVLWPGAPSYAPRLGFVDQAAHARVPFIARQGRDVSYALAASDGVDADFRFDRIGPTEQIATSRTRDLEPGATLEHRRALVVARGGLEAVAEAAWTIAGKRTGRVRGNLAPAPAWATVQAEHDDGKPVLTVRAAKDGSFSLPLPEGRYQLRLVSPGGEDRAPIKVESGREIVADLVPPEPGTLRFSVVDERDRPLAARWIARGIPPTKTPFFGPAERAEGAGSAGYTFDGSGRVELPPGRYLVLFTHGIEYATYERDVTISREQGQNLRVVLPRRVETPGWIACDFHVHAAPSHDSSITLEDRVRSLVAEGVEFAVASDHNHVTDYRATIDRLRASDRVSAAPGVEVSTARWGHFNAYPYPSFLPPPRHADVDPAEIFASVRRLAPGALIQVNHPNMGGIGYFARSRDPAYSPDFDVLEVVNGFELGQADVIDKNLADWFSLLSAGKRYTAVGNSDSHRLGSEWVGYPRTYVRVERDDPGAITPELVTQALRAGRAVVSAGPFIVAKVGGKEPGELATAEDGKITLQVSVRAPAWIDVSLAEAWLDGKRVAIQRANAPLGAAVRLTWQTEIAVERDGWLVVVARGERVLDRVLPGVGAKPFGFTNPIWIDADANGSFDAGLDAAGTSGDAGADAARP